MRSFRTFIQQLILEYGRGDAKASEREWSQGQSSSRSSGLSLSTQTSHDSWSFSQINQKLRSVLERKHVSLSYILVIATDQRQSRSEALPTKMFLYDYSSAQLKTSTLSPQQFYTTVKQQHLQYEDEEQKIHKLIMIAHSTGEIQESMDVISGLAFKVASQLKKDLKEKHDSYKKSIYFFGTAT